MKIRASSATTPGPRSVRRDSRGILDPWLLQQRVRLTRYPPSPELAGIVDRFWAVQWSLPPGAVHRQALLSPPAAKLSVGPANGADEDGPLEARLYGVVRRMSGRTLVGRGWTVAAMTTVGGLGALVDRPAARYTDRVVPLAAVLGDADLEAALVADVAGLTDEPARVDRLSAALTGALRTGRVAAARTVAAVAALAERDRKVRVLADLTERSGIPARTLQRMFSEHAGVAPTWVIRRYRLLDAAEAVRDGREVRWADVAAALGYADQAHLTRDFHAAVGMTPAAYAKAQRPGQ